MIRLLLRVTICLHIYTQYTQYKLNWWLNVNLNPPHAILSLVWRSSVLQLLSVWVFSTVCTWGLSRSYWCVVHCPLQAGRSLTQHWNATRMLIRRTADGRSFLVPENLHLFCKSLESLGLKSKIIFTKLGSSTEVGSIVPVWLLPTFVLANLT